MGSCDSASWFLARGDFARALKSLAAEPATGNSNASQANLRGVAELARGNAKAALAAFDRAIALDGALTVARYNRAVALLKMQEYERASAELDRVVQLKDEPLRAKAAYHRAIAEASLGRNDSAAKLLSFAASADREFVAAQLYLGVVHERRRDFQAAGRAYKSYLEARPDSPAALVRFGVVAMRSGHRDAALSYLRRTITIAPSSPEASEARKYLLLLE